MENLEKELSRTASAVKWVKYGCIEDIQFANKDIIVFGKGPHIILHNTVTGENTIHTVRPGGVSCFSVHRVAPVLSFASTGIAPSIKVLCFPSLSIVSELTGGSEFGYLAICFTEIEHLISLGTVPSYDIIVWSWRTGEKLASVDTDIQTPNQFISCSLSTITYISQVERNSSNFQIWELHPCYKKCLLTKINISSPIDLGKISDCVWLADGPFYIVNSSGNVFSVEPDTKKMYLVYEWVLSENSEEDVCNYDSKIAWYKNGLIVIGPDRQAKGEVCQFQVDGGEKRFEAFYNNGYNFVDFCIVRHNYSEVVTVNKRGKLQVWSIEKGVLLSQSLALGTDKVSMCCYPDLPFIVIGLPTGILYFIDVTKNPKIVESINLCKQEITGLYFTISGKYLVAASHQVGQYFLLKTKVKENFTVMTCKTTGKESVSCCAVEAHSSLYLYILNAASHCCLCGNIIEIYQCSLSGQNTIFEILSIVDTGFMYCTIFQSPTTSIRFFAIPHRSRTIHIIQASQKFTVLTLKGIINTEHQLRKYNAACTNDVLLTWGYDGVVFVRDSSFRCRAAIMSHNWVDCGVRKAEISSTKKWIVSLGCNGALVCTKLGHEEITSTFSEVAELPFKFSSNEELTKDTENVKTWIEIQEELMILEEEKTNKVRKQNIQNDFKALQQEVVKLLEQNFELSPEETLPISEFDMDLEYRSVRTEEVDKQLIEEKIYQEAAITVRNNLARYIKAHSFDLMEFNGCSIKAILGDFSVENYPLFNQEENLEEKIKQVLTRRSYVPPGISTDFIFNWLSTTQSKLEILQSEMSALTTQHTDWLQDVIQQEDQDKVSKSYDPYIFSGSISHRFVDIPDLITHQLSLTTFIRIHDEVYLYKGISNDLRKFFNKQFSDVMALKEKEMSLTIEKNDRLRYILSELKNTRKTVSDPEWSAEEKVEQIFTVEQNELPVTPYVSPSEQAILDQMAKEEEERIRALMADNFRELALIAMMDGVLELRWEDIIKRDIPKPKCMVEKLPENWNDEDLKAIRVYEEKVAFLMSERERYRKMLENEYAQLSMTIRESNLKFDATLSELHELKLQIQSAIWQETLKQYRLHYKALRLEILNRKEAKIIESLKLNEKNMEWLNTTIHELHAAATECRSLYESFLHKDKLLDKNFRKDFPELSQFLGDQLYKIYKRRPKIHPRVQTSVTLLNELSQCVVSHEKPLFLPHEALEFLKGLDTLDISTNAPPSIDDDTWNTFCRVRRAKIEIEFKTKSCALELAEVEQTAVLLQKRIHSEKEKYLNQLTEIRREKSLLLINQSIQLVMKKGLVELPLTGDVRDFLDAILIKRELVESVNTVVLEAGKEKLIAMHENKEFHRKIMLMEWEHKKMQMEIEDLQDELYTIKSVKVTMEILQYLKRKSMGLDEEKALQTAEKELNTVREEFRRLLENVERHISNTQDRINLKKVSNSVLDKQIMELNVTVFEQEGERDPELEDILNQQNKKVHVVLRKRGQLTRKIQEQYNQILVLQTELELLRLRTFPTLKYTTLK